MLIYEKFLLQENMGKGGGVPCFPLLFFPPEIEDNLERRKLTQLVFPIIFFSMFDAHAPFE